MRPKIHPEGMAQQPHQAKASEGQKHRIRVSWPSLAGSESRQRHRAQMAICKRQNQAEASSLPPSDRPAPRGDLSAGCNDLASGPSVCAVLRPQTATQIRTASGVGPRSFDHTTIRGLEDGTCEDPLRRCTSTMRFVAKFLPVLQGGLSQDP